MKRRDPHTVIYYIHPQTNLSFLISLVGFKDAHQAKKKAHEKNIVRLHTDFQFDDM